MYLNPFGCLINRHQPRRESVHWNGFHYVSHCKDCGKPILRKPKGGWRLSKSSTTNSIWGTPDQIEEND